MNWKRQERKPTCPSFYSIGFNRLMVLKNVVRAANFQAEI
jgi:hypothetical protein